MSRTSPVQIVNKNGVQTTVHKRVDNSPASTGRSMPAPKLALPDDDKYRLMVEMSFEMVLNGTKMSENVRSKMMATLHPETLTRIEGIVRENIPMTVMRRVMSICADNRNFAVLNSMALLVPEMDDPSVNNQDNILYALTGLQQDRDDKTPEIDITNPDDPRAQGVRKYLESLFKADGEMRVFRTTLKKQQRYVNFKDREVGKMIIDYPERADEILSLYRSHGSFDRDLYESALATSSTSLMEGAL
jgi:hypothetical protein